MLTTTWEEYKKISNKMEESDYSGMDWVKTSTEGCEFHFLSPEYEQSFRDRFIDESNEII
tara:strand:+ start:2031 stop:2210 length:180 start_codon:yes stop_codon:yes gene_type:complete